MITRDQIVATARSWLGVRWIHQGRSRAGVDCAGLVIKVAEEIGHPAPDMQGYFNRPNGTEFLKHLRANLAKGDVTNPRDGSIGVFKQGKSPCHCAIFSTKNGEKTLIHGNARHRKVSEDKFAFEWVDNLIEVLEYHGVSD